MISRRELLSAAAVMALLPSVAFAQSAEEPAALIQKFYDALLDAMKRGPELGFDGRYELLVPVLNDTFDIGTMCRIAVGPDWTKMPGDKNGALLQVFDRYIVTTYAARFKKFNNLKFEIGETKDAGDGKKLVETKLTRANGEVVELNYLFRQNENAWRVIDIYLAGAISQMAQLRAEFGQSLRQGGADQLMVELEKKIEDLKKEA